MPTLCRARRLEGLATLILLTAFPLASQAEEKREPAEFYVPKSGHLECTVASTDVHGLERVKAIDDVLAFRARVASQLFDRDDVVSWKILEDLGLTKIEDEGPALPPGGIRRGAVDWRDALIDFDETRHAQRLSCDDLEMLWIHTPSAYTWVSFGSDGSSTTVRHFHPDKGQNQRLMNADRALLRSERRFQGEWSVLRSDDAGTLYRRTIVHEANATRPKEVVDEKYLLADPLTDEVLLWAFFHQGHLYRFEIATQPLEKTATPADFVVPGLVLSFDHSTKPWDLSAIWNRKVELDGDLPADAFVYRVQAGDLYQGYDVGEKPEVMRISERGSDIASLQPGEAIAALREAERRFWERVRPRN